MNRARTLLASAAAVIVGAAGLTLVTPVQPAFASASLTVTPNPPVVGEKVAATGRVSTRFKRPVVLKSYSGGAWRTLMSGWTNSTGAYRFSGMPVTAPTTYSVVARAFKHNGRTYSQAVAKRSVRPVAQKGSLAVLPKVSQRGTTPAAADGARNSAIARFYPARPGRTVTFSRLVNGAWVASGRTTERSDGSAVFQGLPAGVPLLAVAEARYGAPAQATNQATDSWGLKFNDEFSSSSTFANQWAMRNEGVYLPSRTKSKVDRRAVYLGGGTVALKVLKDPSYPSSRLLNGQVSTAGRYQFQYGVAAARVKFPMRRGQHGSFWLQSQNYGQFPNDPGRSGAEIDAVEYFGKGYPQGGLANFLYYTNKYKKNVKLGGVWPTAYTLKPSSDTWYNSYHVFAVKWTPDGYAFYVDGRQLWTSTRAVSHVPEYLVLSLLTSDWELRYLDRSKLAGSVMKVDWVRVWQ